MFHQMLHSMLAAAASMAMVVLPSAPLLVRRRPASLAAQDIGIRVQPGRRAAKL
jgi:hypothetical protein